jgi:guanidinopropionase
VAPSRLRGAQDGGDVICLMPTKDSPNQITAQVAMVVMFEIINLVALTLKDGG